MKAILLLLTSILVGTGFEFLFTWGFAYLTLDIITGAIGFLIGASVCALIILIVATIYYLQFFRFTSCILILTKEETKPTKITMKVGLMLKIAIILSSVGFLLSFVTIFTCSPGYFIGFHYDFSVIANRISFYAVHTINLLAFLFFSFSFYRLTGIFRHLKPVVKGGKFLMYSQIIIFLALLTFLVLERQLFSYHELYGSLSGYNPFLITAANIELVWFGNLDFLGICFALLFNASFVFFIVGLYKIGKSDTTLENIETV